MTMHHSGDDERPIRRDSDFLRHLSDAKTTEELQRLHVEAIIKHSESLDRIADALYSLCDPDRGLAFESYSRLKVEAEIEKQA